MKPYLSVIIPAYNEAANLKKGVLTTISDYLKEQDYSYEVIVVDDKSTDNTLALLEKFAGKNANFKIIPDIHNGKAFTLMRGVQEANGNVLLLMDMDQATPISEISKLLPYFKEGYDVVVGSRGNRREKAPIGRKVLSTGQVILRNSILGFKNIQDTQCGFKAYTREALLDTLSHLYIFSYKNAVAIDFPSVSAGFDVEVLFVATKLGYKIKEVPVEWDYKMSRRVNLIKDALRGIKELVYLKALEIKGVYKF